MSSHPHPTLINLPPPPSDPVTPSDMGPGTPNSTTTSMSELSTIAIKDGHRGHHPHHPSGQPNPLDAERADRISRLTGLDRVAVARQPQPFNPNATSNPAGPISYFDSAGQPQMLREKSTVGSASATGSVGGRTTWASGSDVGGESEMTSNMETDRDIDMDTSSIGGQSANTEGPSAFGDNDSLVGFGEGARTPARRTGSPGPGQAYSAYSKPTVMPSHLRHGEASTSQGGGAPMSGVSSPNAQNEMRDARMLDGVTYDPDVLDTSTRTPPVATPRESEHLDAAERIMKGISGEGRLESPQESEGGGKTLGRFDFERK